MSATPEPLSTTAKVAAWCFLAALALIMGLGFYALRQREVAQAYQTKASTVETENRALVKDATASRLQALQDRTEREKAAQEVERLSKALAAAQRPPKPAPAPEGDPELAKGLETAGLLTGLVIFRGDGPSRMARHDASMVWDWNAQALRVPALELRLDAAEDLVKGQDREIGALKLESNAWATSSDQWQAAHGLQAQQTEALKTEVVTLHKAAVADKWRTWAEVALALFLGYAAGSK